MNENDTGSYRGRRQTTHYYASTLQRGPTPPFRWNLMAESGGHVRIQGYAFVFNQSSSLYKRKPETRVRIFGVADPQLIVIVLPPETNVDTLKYDVDTYSGRLTLTDGLAFMLDMNEFGDDSAVNR